MSDNLLTYGFAFFLYLSLHLLMIWGLFWILRTLAAPLIRDIIRGSKDII